MEKWKEQTEESEQESENSTTKMEKTKKQMKKKECRNGRGKSRHKEFEKNREISNK